MFLCTHLPLLPPPSLQAFQKSADFFLALLPELLAAPVDTEMRLCQQSLLVRVPPSPSTTPPASGTEAMGLSVYVGGTQAEDCAHNYGV